MPDPHSSSQTARIVLRFHAYYRDLTGTSIVYDAVPVGTTLAELRSRVTAQFPQLAPLAQCTLVAVGLDYQSPDYQLNDGDEVSFFPPVQGG